MNNNFDQQSYGVPNYAGFDLGAQNDPAKKTKPLSITSMVLGILAILSCCCCCASVIFIPVMGLLGVGAIVLAIIVKVKTGKFDGMALAGLILGILSIIVCLIAVAMLLYVMSIPLEELEKILADAFGEDFSKDFMKGIQS